MAVNEEHRSFSTLLTDLEDGALHAELSDQIKDIVAKLHDTAAEQGGKPSAILTIKMGFKLDSGVIEVAADVKATLPKRSRRKSIMYATPDNNLTRRNPRQQELPLRDVNASAGVARAV
jgi:hypothetical protein